MLALESLDFANVAAGLQSLSTLLDKEQAAVAESDPQAESAGADESLQAESADADESLGSESAPEAETDDSWVAETAPENWTDEDKALLDEAEKPTLDWVTR